MWLPSCQKYKHVEGKSYQETGRTTQKKLASILTQQDWEVKCLEIEDYFDALEQKILVVFDKLVILEEKTIHTE